MLRGLLHKSCQENSSREPGRRFHKEILSRDIAQRSFELLLTGLLQRSCQETSYKDLVHRSCQDTSSGDLVQRYCIKILLQRSCQEVSYILLQTSCQQSSEILYRDLSGKPLLEILCRDLERRAEVLLGDHLSKDVLEVKLPTIWTDGKAERCVCVCLCVRGCVCVSLSLSVSLCLCVCASVCAHPFTQSMVFGIICANHMWACMHSCATHLDLQGGQAYHIHPGPTKLGCNRGSIKGRFVMYPRFGLKLLNTLFYYCVSAAEI